MNHHLHAALVRERRMYTRKPALGRWLLAAVTGAALLTAAGTSQAATLAPLHGVGNPHAIKEQYVVVLKTGATAASVERRAQQARDHGGHVHRQYAKALKGFAATLSDKALADVRADPAVAYVEQDAVIAATATQTMTSHLSMQAASTPIYERMRYALNHTSGRPADERLAVRLRAAAPQRPLTPSSRYVWTTIDAPAQPRISPPAPRVGVLDLERTQHAEPQVGHVGLGASIPSRHESAAKP